MKLKWKDWNSFAVVCAKRNSLFHSTLSVCVLRGKIQHAVVYNATNTHTHIQSRNQRHGTSNHRHHENKTNVQYVKLPHKLVMIWKLKLFIASFGCVWTNERESERRKERNIVSKWTISILNTATPNLFCEAGLSRGAVGKKRRRRRQQNENARNWEKERRNDSRIILLKHTYKVEQKKQ